MATHTSYKCVRPKDTVIHVGASVKKPSTGNNVFRRQLKPNETLGTDDVSKGVAHIGLYLFTMLVAGIGAACVLLGIFLGNMSDQWDDLRRYSSSLLMLTVSIFGSVIVNYYFAYKPRKDSKIYKDGEDYTGKDKDGKKQPVPFENAESQIQLWRSIEWTVTTPLFVATAMSYAGIGLTDSEHAKPYGADFGTTLGAVLFFSTMIQLLYTIAQRGVFNTNQSFKYGQFLFWAPKKDDKEQYLRHFDCFTQIAGSIGAAVLLILLWIRIYEGDYAHTPSHRATGDDLNYIRDTLVYAVGARTLVQLVWLVHPLITWIFVGRPGVDDDKYLYDYHRYALLVIVIHEVVMYTLDVVGRVGMLYMIVKHLPGGL